MHILTENVLIKLKYVFPHARMLNILFYISLNSQVSTISTAKLNQLVTYLFI